MIGTGFGWVIQIYPDESLSATIRVGSVLSWDDARASGKRPGQHVLFLRTGPGTPVWWGTGRVLLQEERWRVHGIRTRCEAIFHPPLPTLSEGGEDRGTDGRASRKVSYVWDNRALGATLGLAHYQERTPYLETGARDLRLTGRDLRQLQRLQPGLGGFSLS